MKSDQTQTTELIYRTSFTS